MYSIFWLKNKNYLINILTIWGGASVGLISASLMNMQSSSLSGLYVSCLIMCYMYSVVILFSSNSFFYNKNMEWILTLPVKKLKLLVINFIFNIIQLIESFLIMLIWGWVFVRLAGPSDTKSLSQVDKDIPYKIKDEVLQAGIELVQDFDIFKAIKYFFVTADNFSFLINILVILVFVLFCIHDGKFLFQKIKVNYTKKQYRKILIVGASAAAVIYIFSRLPFDLIFSAPIFMKTGSITLFISISYVQTIHTLRIRSLKLLQIARGGLIIFTGFFLIFWLMANSNINSKNLDGKNRVDEMLFLGSMIKEVRWDQVRLLMKSKIVNSSNISTLIKRYLKAQKRKYFNQEEFNTILEDIYDQDKFSTIKVLLKFTKLDFLSTKDLIKLTKHNLKVREYYQIKWGKFYANVLTSDITPEYVNFLLDSNSSSLRQVGILLTLRLAEEGKDISMIDSLIRSKRQLNWGEHMTLLQTIQYIYPGLTDLLDIKSQYFRLKKTGARSGLCQDWKFTPKSVINEENLWKVNRCSQYIVLTGKNERIHTLRWAQLTLPLSADEKLQVEKLYR